VTEGEKSIVAEVEDMARRYFHNYSAAVYRCLTDGTPIDYDALGFWTFPMLFVTGSESNSHVTVVGCGPFDEQVLAICQRYCDGGWAGELEVNDARVSIVTSDVALVETKGHRFTADGGIYNDWRSCLWVRRSPTAWRQFAVTETERPRPLTSEWVAWLSATAHAPGENR
jgi:hypothetical protein